MPSGTVTFLFTDIEGSTKLWEAHPQEMGVALARHDALMRSAIGGVGGYVFKTVGDAFCAAFSTASDALHAALEAQRALHSEPWPETAVLRVRMGLHTGAAECRDDDYFGKPLNRVARLLAVGHGGQVLLSQPTYDLVQDASAEEFGFESLGEHRLKDLGRPEVVFQLLHPELPNRFAPLRSLDNPELPNNLPLQVTSLVGREKEIGEVLALMGGTRLLTLTGAGGCGKTRLALQAAAESIDGTGDGVWLVELAPLTDPTLVPQTVAGVLGIKEAPGKTPTQNLVEHLASKDILLALDNCEHVIDACAALADAVLRGCPRVQILATSREGMGIAGETTYRVPSLSLPDPSQPQTPQSLSLYESVRLFVERATQVETTFAVTNQNAPALASVCHRLDGIPLAIELAAARVRSLSVEEIEQRLDQRFRLLTGGPRMALPRQQTLRSLIDWSYDLLTESEKVLLCRLSVFSGGWTLESAGQVCAGDPFEEWEVLDLLESLCDKSLVVADQAGGTTRYRMLETVRQYGRDRMLEAGGEALRDRHMGAFLALTQEAEPHLRGAEQLAWLDRLETEHDNLRAALEWSCESDTPGHVGLRMAGALWRFWFVHGHLSEGRERLSRALALGGADDPSTRANALNGAGNLAQAQGDYTAARALHDQSLSLRRALNDRYGIAGSLNNLGLAATELGDIPAARALYEESLQIFRELGERWGIVAPLSNLGVIAFDQGDYAAAWALTEECLAVRRELGDQFGIALSLSNLGNVAFAQENLSVGRTLHEQSLELYRELGDRLGMAVALEALASTDAALGGSDLAARLWGAAERLREEVGSPLPPSKRSVVDKWRTIARASTDGKEFDRAWQEGRALTLNRAIELALKRAGD